MPGQLDREIAAGGWHVVPARMDQVFRSPKGPDWHDLLPETRSLSVRAVIPASDLPIASR